MSYKYLLDSNKYYLLDSNNKYLQVYYYNPYVIGQDEYRHIVNNGNIIPIFKFYLLNEDETINTELTDYIVEDSGSLSIDYNNGVRRRMNVNLYLPERELPINPFGGIIWKGKKFKLELGIKTPAGEFLKPAGIFVLVEFSADDNNKSNIFTLSLVDKFGNLDGTTGGSISDSIEISRGSNIKDVIKSLLNDDRISGIPYDCKPAFFGSGFMNKTTPYTISKTSGSTIGEIIIELAGTLNYEVYYNEYGVLVFTDSSDSIMVNTESPIWEFQKDIDMSNIQMSSKPQEVYNIVVVEGGNINGSLMDAVAKNTNSKSPTNISIWEPKTYKVQDENISSENLAQKRAEYELFYKSLFQFDLTFNTLFLPHLDVNKIVTVSSDFLKLNNTKCLITGISIPISSKSQYVVTAKNIEEVAFNE